MIDARDQLSSAPASQHSSRRAKSSRGARGRLPEPCQDNAMKATAKAPKTASPVLKMERIFSDAKTKPFDQIEWERRTAEITDDAGKVIFKQENVEVPKSWSVLATKVVVSKYFYGEQHTA